MPSRPAHLYACFALAPSLLVSSISPGSIARRALDVDDGWKAVALVEARLLLVIVCACKACWEFRGRREGGEGRDRQEECQRLLS